MVRQSKLNEGGWEEPTDESPVETPEEWEGGGVIHTGGDIWNRVWTHEKEDEMKYEVGYGDEFEGADLQKYTYDSDRETWEFARVIQKRESEEKTDTGCAEVALELMQRVEELDDDRE